MCKWSDPFSKRVLIGRGLDHNSLETLKSQRKNVSSDYSVLKARPSKKHWTEAQKCVILIQSNRSVSMTVRFHLFPFLSLIHICPHKQWSMWFNSTQREEPYQVLTSCDGAGNSIFLRDAETGGAWLSSCLLYTSLLTQMEQFIKEQDPTYNCIIKVEQSYTAAHQS